MNVKRLIKFFILILGGLVFAQIVVFAVGGGTILSNLLIYPDNGSEAINFYRPAYSGGTDPGQNVSIGWRTFGDETFDIFTPEYCKNITHSGPVDIFIPTRTPGEWNSFKNRTKSGGVSVSSCAIGTGCDIDSGYICGTVCTGFGLCEGGSETFANECEMIGSGRIMLSLGTCNGCDPNSGPVSGSVPCNPLKDQYCTDAINCTTYANDCAMQAAGAVLCSGGGV